MISNFSNNKRIAKNTLILYVRMLFMMLVALYTSRVILNVLGVEDFGIYNVVGGLVSMFALVSGKDIFVFKNQSPNVSANNINNKHITI